jgi:hypothetical protein
MRKTTMAFALTLATVLLLQSAALATAKPRGLTYTTTTEVFDVQTTAQVASLAFESPNEYGEICVAFDLTVHGTFQYWTGAEFVTMTQDPVPQRARNCRNLAAFRQDLVAFYLDPIAGTFDLSGLTTYASPVYFGGSDGSIFLFGSIPLAPKVLNATTDKQRKTIRDLQARADRLADTRLVAELNDLLSLFASGTNHKALRSQPAWPAPVGGVIRLTD